MGKSNEKQLEDVGTTERLPVIAQSEKTKYGVLFPDGHVEWAADDGRLGGEDIRTVSGQRAYRNERVQYLKSRFHITQIEDIDFVQQTTYTGVSGITDFLPLT